MKRVKYIQSIKYYEFIKNDEYEHKTVTLKNAYDNISISVKKPGHKTILGLQLCF